LAEGKNVRFITNATDNQILEAYRESMLTVLPSVYTDCYGIEHARPELLGLTLLESQACGTPVICTAVGGMPEFVVHDVTGIVVPPNNSGAIRIAIERLSREPTLACSMGLAGRALVEKRFTWHRVAERCLDVYRRTQ
jgi:glycosyltransferase involved in cell wall biosynthesis